MLPQHKRQLGFLLIIALGIIYFQVIIGGITRLTGSGLSITDWKIVTGTFPPLSADAWQVEFDQYKATPQYQEINKGMSMSDFKFIYFWEWLHRVWGRWGFLFILGIFGWFLYKKQLDATAKKRFLLLLFLYFCQGLLGWFMVLSGLSKMPQVSHYRLTAHLLGALFLFVYILWWVVQLIVPKEQLVVKPKLRRFAWVIVGVLVLQIIFGAFMSGLRAATSFPTFPDMNGQLIPSNLFALKPFILNFFENHATIQFTHRLIAYLLCGLILWFWVNAREQIKSKAYPWFSIGTNMLPIVLLLQVGLGISVLLFSQGTVPVGLGSMHQAVGLLLLSTMTFVSFQLRSD